MLPTTRSRCHLVLFRSLPAEFVADRLRDLRPGADPSAVAYAARHAEGSLGIAVRQVDDGLYALKRTWGDRLGELLAPARGFASHRLAVPLLSDARELADFVSDRDPDVSPTDATREGLRMLLAVIADFYLDALRIQAGSFLTLVNEDQKEVVEALAARCASQPLGRSLRHMGAAEADLARNANLDLTLETLFIRLAGEMKRR